MRGAVGRGLERLRHLHDGCSLSGAGVGAGTGALIGLAFGGVGAIPGALIGAGAGGATGAFTDEEQIYLGEAVWDRDDEG